MDNIQNNNGKKNSDARIRANNRYKNKTYKRIAIDIKPAEAEYIRAVANENGLSIAQMILQAVKAFDKMDSTDNTAE